MTILEIIAIVVIVGLFLIFLVCVKGIACCDCPNKHRCDDLTEHGHPNLCEQNELMNDWHNNNSCL